MHVHRVRDSSPQLGQLTPLRELMMAQNARISTLPESFYQLTNLRTLNMEMCPSMVFPPLKYFEKGVAAVLEWSEGRVAHHRHLKKHRVIDRLSNLCDQLTEQAPFFGRQAMAFFQANVERDDEKYYAIALPKNNFVPVKVSVKKVRKLLDAEANRKVGKSKAAKAEAEDRALLAALCPGGLHPDVTRKLCEKVLGWIPLTARGGDKGIAVRNRYRRLNEVEEAREGEAVARKLGGGDVPDSKKDMAAELAAKRAVKEAKEARAKAEAVEMNALGAVQDTCVVLEAVEGSDAARAGVNAGQRVATVDGVEVDDWSTFLEHLLRIARGSPEDGVEYGSGAGKEKDDEDGKDGKKDKKDKKKARKGPKSIEVRFEMSGGRAALFWEKLLPLLEEYWSHGRDNPDEFVIPKRYAQSFPFERDYLDRVLRTFKDPWSAVCIESGDDKPVMFRRCGCVDEQGKRKVCVPPQAGFMCSRPALLLKMEVKLQRQKDAHDAALRQEAEIAAVEAIAKGSAEQWVLTEAGKKYLKEHAEKAAESVVLKRRKENAASKLSAAATRKLEALDRRFRADKKRLEEALEKKGSALTLRRAKLETEAATTAGLARDLKEKEIDKVNGELASLPEALALEELKEAHQDRVDAITDTDDDGGVAGLADSRSVSHTSSEYRKVLGELVTDIGRQYVEREMRKARDAKLRELENMAKIRKAWGGVGLKDCFVAWRRCVPSAVRASDCSAVGVGAGWALVNSCLVNLDRYARLNVNTRFREDARLKRAKFAASEVPKAAIKVARYKVLLWGAPVMDVWSDELYWVHRKTGEIRWTKPTTQEYCPKGFVMPAEYAHLTDSELDAIHVRDDVPFEDVEVPYQKEELGSDASSSEDTSSDESSSDDSDSDDESEEESEEEEEEGDDDRKALASGATSSAATTIGSDDGGSSEGDQSEDEVEMIEGPDGQLVPMKKKRKPKLEDMEVPEPKPPEPLEVYVERTYTEASAALVRMRNRRVAANERAQAQFLIALGAKERARLAEEERKEREHLGLPEITVETGSSAGNGAGKKGSKAAGEAKPVSTEDVGFDPDKPDYTEEQLTNMAMELYFKNLEKGLDEEGNPIKKGIFG